MSSFGKKLFLHKVFCGGDLDEMIDFQKGKIRSLGVQKMRATIWLNVTIFKKKFEFGLPLDMVTTFSEKRPSSSHRKWGDDFAKNADFQRGKLSLVCHFIWKNPRMVRTKCMKAIQRKWQFKKGKPLMHDYITSHGGDLNEI